MKSYLDFVLAQETDNAAGPAGGNAAPAGGAAGGETGGNTGGDTVTGQDGNAQTKDDGTGKDTGESPDKGNPMIFILMIIAIMYFFMFRGPSKQRKEHQKLMETLKKNDRIRTIGGIMGTVVDVRADQGEVVIKIDESNNTKMRIARQAVATIITDEKEAADK